MHIVKPFNGLYFDFFGTEAQIIIENSNRRATAQIKALSGEKASEHIVRFGDYRMEEISGKEAQNSGLVRAIFGFELLFENYATGLSDVECDAHNDVFLEVNPENRAQ